MPSFTQDEPFLLITIPQSHFCEKARWALDRAKIPYREEAHLPMFHLPATLLRGGKQTVPVLKSRIGTFDDSTNVLHYVDSFLDEKQKLFPADGSKDIARLENHFDEVLGPAGRIWVYWHLLPEKELSISIVENTVPAYQAKIGRALFGVVRAMMKRKMKLNAETAANGLEKVRDVFDEVGRLLADGRPFLTGDRFTAADLTFASLAAIVTLPAEYGGPLPTLENAPPKMQETVKELREYPAGKFVLKMFATQRR
jgi:glutathione S-transferase